MSALKRARARARITLRRRRKTFDLRREQARARGLVESGRKTGARIAPKLGPPLTAILSAPLVAAAAAITLASHVGAWIGDRIASLSAALRPELAVAAVAAAAAALLGLSQFVHYTIVEVDASAYRGSIGRVAPAPTAAPQDAGAAHAYVLLGIAVLALVLIALTLLGRWRFGRLVALCGLIGIAVSLIIDLPQGLDAGRAGIAYEGSKAILTEGFYAQLSASAVLAFSGALLAVFAHRAHPAPREGSWRIGRARRRRSSSDRRSSARQRSRSRASRRRTAMLGGPRSRWGTGA